MKSKRWLKHLPLLAGVALVILALVAGVVLKDLLFEESVQQKRMVQQVTVIAPPPPPPPPPPEVEESEIEEEVIEEQIDEALPDDSSADEAPGDQLGLDADGGAGGDGFGLLAKRGGRGLLGGGGYGATLKSAVNRALVQDDELQHMAYEAIVTLWVEQDGSIREFDVELVDGENGVKNSLQRFFRELENIGTPKPLEEQDDRFRLRISSVI